MNKYLISGIAVVAVILVLSFAGQKNEMQNQVTGNNENKNMIENNEVEEESEMDSMENMEAGETEMKAAEVKTSTETSAKSKPAPAAEPTGFTWKTYVKPDVSVLKATMDPIAFKVTQEEGTEKAGTHPYDKLYDRGIYVDILSGEPLYSSRDKYDSTTGWPSWTAPISKSAVTEHEDRKLFSTRTEIRSTIADNHIGHVFDDGPKDKGGLRYCMNGVALRFVAEADMAAEGYGDWLSSL